MSEIKLKIIKENLGVKCYSKADSKLFAASKNWSQNQKPKMDDNDIELSLFIDIKSDELGEYYSSYIRNNQCMLSFFDEKSQQILYRDRVSHFDYNIDSQLKISKLGEKIPSIFSFIIDKSDMDDICTHSDVVLVVDIPGDKYESKDLMKKIRESFKKINAPNQSKEMAYVEKNSAERSLAYQAGYKKSEINFLDYEQYLYKQLEPDVDMRLVKQYEYIKGLLKEAIGLTEPCTERDSLLDKNVCTTNSTNAKAQKIIDRVNIINRRVFGGLYKNRLKRLFRGTFFGALNNQIGLFAENEEEIVKQWTEDQKKLLAIIALMMEEIQLNDRLSLPINDYSDSSDEKKSDDDFEEEEEEDDDDL